MTPSLELTKGHLGESLTSQYWDDGFLFPLPAVSPEKALGWRQRLETVEREYLDGGLPLPLNTYKRVNAQIVMPLAYEIGTEPGILDVVEDLLGPDILLYASEFFVKEPNTAHLVTMHQDLTYWGLGAIDGLVTAWIALSPATPASGCMDFVRGSHKNAILPHKDSDDPNNLLSRGQEIQVEVAPEDRTTIEIHPGQMSLHHGLTIHGSGPNASDDRRIAAVIRYVRPDVVPDGDTEDYGMLVRGQIAGSRFIDYPPPASDFDPEALKRFDEIRAYQAKIKMAGAKATSGMYG